MQWSGRQFEIYNLKSINFMSSSSSKSLVKPPALRPGDTIGIAAPASDIKPAALEAGELALKKLGYNPLHQQDIFERDLYFAGSPERRAAELKRMVDSDVVRAVLCARGGYGCNYLLPRIDVFKWRRRPRIFVGYSDLTALLTWFVDNGIVAFHGPMVAKDFAADLGVDLTSFQACVQGERNWALHSGGSEGFRGLVSGSGAGVLYGGCLSILVASLGTPYEIHTDGKLLFLEDINTKPYQVDRMLMQLKLAGKLEGVSGIVFGEMVNCIQSPGQPYTLEEVIVRVLADLKVPVAFGLRSGHVSKQNITLPFGVRASLQVEGPSARLEILESAVTKAG